MNKEAEVEYLKWNSYFEEALKGNGKFPEKDLWKQSTDEDLLNILQSLFSSEQSINMLEAGCGSGRHSFTIAKHLNIESITLLDFCQNAIEFAKSQHPDYLRGKVNYIEGDITQLPFQNCCFDLTWNIGVIEHYSKSMILKIVTEMLRVTKQEGCVLIGIPNRTSIAVFNAWLLGTKVGRKFLAFAEGYRFDTEILYGANELAKLFEEAMGVSVKITYAGSCVWVGAPDVIVRYTRQWLRQSPLSFLTFFIVRKESL